MTRLTNEETEAVRLDQLSRIVADRMCPVAAGFTFHTRFCLEPEARRAKTRYHVLVRPLESGRLRLVLAASRRIGEIRGVATWLVGDRFWMADAEFDFHGMAGWIVDWRADAPRGQDRVDLLGKPAPVWPWAPLANATAAMVAPRRNGPTTSRGRMFASAISRAFCATNRASSASRSSFSRIEGRSQFGASPAFASSSARGKRAAPAK